MPWTWNEIDEVWFGREVLAEPAEIVASFNTVEELLGRQWILDQYPDPKNFVIYGAACAEILLLGRELNRFRNSSGIEELIRKLRGGDSSPRAELDAAYLCAGGDAAVEVEFGVEIATGKMPDFRARRGHEPWTWVEVSAPDFSDAAKDVMALMDQLGDLLTMVPYGRFAEIFIRRDLTPADVILVRRDFGIAVSRGRQTRLDTMQAIILYDHFAPQKYRLDALAEAQVPRISTLHFDKHGPSPRELLVRHALSDARAVRLLRREAEQLPRDEPGIIMLQNGISLGPLAEWPPLIEAALRPGQHTRVSAAALFFVAARGPMGEVAPTVEITAAARLIRNKNARNPAPDWLLDRLQNFRSHI
jgi:hypothetical protein